VVSCDLIVGDVLLLAVIFERFRIKCLETYKLDPAFYLSAAQLSFDAALKKTDAHLDLISDPAMFTMIDSGIRGGISMISNRYAKANNPLVAGYDPSKPKSWIKGLDANNLYGWAMSQALPISDFEWVPQDELNKINWLSLKEDDTKGYIVTVDLEYPSEIHDAHNDYPLAPERMRVKDEWLSDKLINIRSQYNMPRGDGTSKLIPNLMDKKGYVIHYQNLRFYLEHGMKLTKVYNAIRFTQKAWLQSYIEMNQKLRAEATTTFDTDFYKLMNNAVFGKTCENQKKRTNIAIIQDKQKLLDYAAKPTFMNFRIFGDDLMAIETQKTQNLINRPFYAGFAILELAKLHMYRYVFLISCYFIVGRTSILRHINLLTSYQ